MRTVECPFCGDAIRDPIEGYGVVYGHCFRCREFVTVDSPGVVAPEMQRVLDQANAAGEEHRRGLAAITTDHALRVSARRAARLTRG